MLNETLIPTELTIAPNPLGLTPNLKLKTVPIDAHTCFEVWSLLPGHTLLPEEACLLQSDCQRLEEICDKLVWLLSAVCVDETNSWGGEPLHDWRTIHYFVKQSGYQPSAIDVCYYPQLIGPVPEKGKTKGWVIQPARWQISLLEFKSVGHGFQAQTIPFHLQVSLGQPITRSVGSLVA